MQRQGREEWPELVLGAHMKKAKDQYQFFSVALLAPLALWHPYVGINAKEAVRESPLFFNLPVESQEGQLFSVQMHGKAGKSI
jgi:hypothetical protein